MLPEDLEKIRQLEFELSRAKELLREWVNYDKPDSAMAILTRHKFLIERTEGFLNGR